MCIHTIYLCGICQAPVGCYTQPCPPQFQQAPDHTVRYCQPYTISPPAPYSCPNSNCIASTELHWALREQQAIAVQQGKAKLGYTPFDETKAMCGDNDEASDLALEPVQHRKPKTKRVPQAPPSPEPAPGYPPTNPQGKAPLRPDWLSSKEWNKVRELQSRGNNILEMAHAVDKNASKLRIYVDTYLKDVSPLPLPSANSTNSSDSTTNSTSGSTGSEDGLFPLNEQVTVPQAGMPDPSFLNYEEQALAFRMFQQNNTIRNMASRLHKNRQKLSQYINAYMRPKLLKLQAEERAAEDAATPTPITPLTGGICQFPDSNPVAPITAATTSTLLTGGNPQSLTSQTVAPIAVTPGPTSSQGPSFHSNDNSELHAFFMDPLLFPAAVIETEVHKTNGEVALLGPKSASDGDDSLFGDSPVGEKHVGSQFVSMHHEVEPAQPTPRKRKCENSSDTPRASKRLRNRSFP